MYEDEKYGKDRRKLSHSVVLKVITSIFYMHTYMEVKLSNGL